MNLYTGHNRNLLQTSLNYTILHTLSSFRQRVGIYKNVILGIVLLLLIVVNSSIIDDNNYENTRRNNENTETWTPIPVTSASLYITDMLCKDM
jgi:hypothetical protein